MMTDDNERRHSRALEPALISDENEKAEAEARNGLLQYDLGMQFVRTAIEREPPFRLRLSLILSLHRQALEGISRFAGIFRPAGVEIQKSNHKPPGAHLVPELVEDLCDYVNANWDKTAIHLAAYAMWRLNWIHPFDDGNGRTSRVLSYLVLCIHSRKDLPGSPTIPDLIKKEHSHKYYDALDDADEHLLNGNVVDVSKIETLLGDLLAKQLLSYYKSAGGLARE